MNIAVLGGTFDPVHNGHLLIAEEAKTRLNLARVLFVPAGMPWLKDATPLAPADDRMNMVRLAIKDRAGFGLSDMEIKRPGPSYTVDTIAELKAREYPADELYFIIGWDCLAELTRWRQPWWAANPPTWPPWRRLSPASVTGWSCWTSPGWISAPRISVGGWRRGRI